MFNLKSKLASKSSKVLFLIIILSCFGFSAQGQQILRVGHVMGTDIARHKALVLAKEFIENATNGDLKIEIYPESQLGDVKEILAGVQAGAIDMGCFGEIALLEPQLDVFTYPYVFKSVEEMMVKMELPIVKELYDNVEKKGVKVLDYSLSGVRVLTTKNKPVRTLEDLKGLRIRVPNVEALIVGFDAMGASAQPMAFSEVYLALQQGVLDGQENPPPQINTANLYEVCKYVSLTNHVINPIFLFINSEVFNNLNEDYRAALLAGARLWSGANTAMVLGDSDLLMKKFENYGCEIIIPDREPFAKAATKGIKNFPEIENIYNLLQQGD